MRQLEEAVLLGKPLPILGDWTGPAALAMWQWRYALDRYQGAGG